MNAEPTIIDLFSGCGGFGLGAKLAGFNITAAIDIDATLQSAYSFNFPKTRVIQGDLAEMSEEAWTLITQNKQIDGVIGGPPCQGYSRMGYSKRNDPRRTLLGHFFRNINIIKPKFFVMENVEGLIDKKNKYELESALSILDKNYTVLDPFIVDASEYGAPTKRKRVIVFGYLPSFFNPISLDVFAPNEILKTTVKDAIYDINEPISSIVKSEDYGWKKYRPVKLISQYALKMRELPPENLGSKIALDFLSRGYISGNFNTKHTDAVKERFKATPTGTTERVSRAKKLDWSGLCPTLRAGTGPDRGSHQAVRPIHPKQPRVITVREAARLQGFPDWFCFHPTKWHSFRMIGNSVSPVVSEYLLSIIYDNLKSTRASKAAQR